MSEGISIRGDKGQIVLEIMGYENPQAQSLEDSNWLRAAIMAQAGPFSGTIEFGITTDELAKLYRELATSTNTLSGTIRFTTMEGNWELTVSFEKSGKAVLNGVIRPRHAEGNVLHYELRTDPIALEITVRDLRRATEKYPIKIS